MAWYVLYQTAGGRSSRTCATQDDALAIARGLLASGFDVRQVGSLEHGCENDTLGADEIRMLFSAAGRRGA